MRKRRDTAPTKADRIGFWIMMAIGVACIVLGIGGFLLTFAP